jgi:hypothetical protein
VVIRHSAAQEIRQLVERVTGDDPLNRDAASARLSVIGERAVGTLVGALDRNLTAPALAAILRTLEAIHDPRSVSPAIRLVDAADIDVASAAIAVLRGFLRSADGSVADATFERLTAITLDPTRPEAVRAVALEALSDLPAATTTQVLRELEHDTSVRLASAGTRRADRAGLPVRLAELTSAARCPGPDELRAMVAAEGPSAPLGTLRRLVGFLREREASETATERRTEWQAVRAAVHQVLAARGSRLAVYDLRETLATVPGPLPVGFVAALETVGDASCLSDLAAAYLRARGAKDAWWTEHLAAAFRTIVARERLTRRSAALRQVATRWPQAAEELMPRRA